MNIAAVTKQTGFTWQQFGNSCYQWCVHHTEMEITFQPSFTGFYQMDSYTSSWTFPVGQRKGTLHMPSSLAQTDRDAHHGEFPNFSGNHWSFANTKLTTTVEGERRGGSHSIWHVVPSIVPFEILLVGGETICRLGWYFSFMQMCQSWKTLLLIKFEIPEGKAYVSPLYCARCSARYG